MNSLLQTAPNFSSSLQALYSPVAREVEQAEEILRTELRSRFPEVDEIVRYGVLLGGKRLRPALLLLTGKAIGELTAEHIVLAAVVEMIHTATLVHDDVLDDAETRRHLATVNSRWDNKTSVLLGDFLFTHAFYLASTLPTTWACRLIGRATNTVCEGEMRQQASMGDYSLTEDVYLSMISAKTAELCACSCELGAAYAGANPALAGRMACFGRQLGIAFQIADDVLDLAGDEQLTGKSLGTDLAQQKPTLPIIRLLQRATSTEREGILSILNGTPEDRLPRLLPLLDRYGAVTYARNKALEYAERAQSELESLPPGPSRDTLATLTHFAVARSR